MSLSIIEILGTYNYLRNSVSEQCGNFSRNHSSLNGGNIVENETIL